MAHFADEDFACYKGDEIRSYKLEKLDNDFQEDLKEIIRINNTKEFSNIKKVEEITKIEKNVRKMYRFNNLAECDDDQLTFLIRIYNDVILSVLRELEDDLPKDKLTKYKKYYEQVEESYKKLLNARKKITEEMLTKAVNNSRYNNSFSSKISPVSRNKQKEEDTVLHFKPPQPQKKPNPYARGNEKVYEKHKQELKEQKTTSKRGISEGSPDDSIPPPPPPLIHVVTPPKSPSKRSSARSPKSPKRLLNVVTPPKESSRRGFLDSLSLSRSITAKHVDKLKPSRSQASRRGGRKTRKNAKN